MSLTAACCNTPSNQDAHWHNKGEYTTLSKKIAGEEVRTYVTGPKDSKRGLIAIYDIFGYHPTGLQFFDRIAESHGGFQVSVPDIFGKEGGIDDALMGDGSKVMAWIGAFGDYKKNHIDEIIRVAVEDLRKAGCTSFSIFGQCWGALMAVKAASEEDSPFLAAGGPHPSFFNIDAVKDVKAPLVILASKDEADMIPVIESVKGKNFPVESFHSRFDNMHHGWTGAESPTYIPTAKVLDHFDYEINEVMGGVECTDGTRKRCRIVLLAGLDLIQTMSTPGVWDERDLDHILGNYGVFALERTGTEIDSTLANLKQWEKNIHIIRQVVTNDISSTKIRLLLKRNMSIDYLIPDLVVSYIFENNLYRDLDMPDSKGKENAITNGPDAGTSTG